MRAFFLVVTLVGAACSAAPTTSDATRAQFPGCAGATAPLGALPSELPIWCEGPLAASADDTARRSENSWSDGFTSGVSHARLPASYVTFERARTASGALTTVYRTQQFVHNGHWMVDIAGHGTPAEGYEGSAKDFFTGPNNGGALMRPTDAFRFVEASGSPYASAAEIAEWNKRHPEGPPPTERLRWASPTAQAIWRGATKRGRESRRRRFPRFAWLSAASGAGAHETFGGAPTAEPQRSAWHLCAPSDADTACRDHFRIELRRDAVIIAVNGVTYMSHRGLPIASQLPAALLDSRVYVYFASWAYLTDDLVARVHWGRIAINPSLALMR